MILKLGESETYQIEIHISIGIYNENVNLGFGWFADVLSILVFLTRVFGNDSKIGGHEKHIRLKFTFP